MRTKTAIYRSFLPDIINIDTIVPASRSNNVLIVRIEFYAENSIWMSGLVTASMHFKNSRFGLLVIKLNNSFITTCSEKKTINIVIDSIKLCLQIIWICMPWMQTSSRSCMPMLNPTICLSCYKNIGCFHLCWYRSPSNWSDWHVIRCSVLIQVLTQSKCTFFCLSIIYTNCAISISAS
jgi:hypothetical protein